MMLQTYNKKHVQLKDEFKSPQVETTQSHHECPAQFSCEQDDSAGDKDKEQQEEEKKSEEVPQAAEHAGKTSHDTPNVQQSDTSRDAAGKNDNESEEVSTDNVSRL